MKIIDSNSITIKIQNMECQVPVKYLPIISQSTKGVFEKLNMDTPKCLNYPLKDKVCSLLDTVKKLENAKNHETRNKVLAVLISVIGIAFIVAPVLLIPTTVAIAAFMLVSLIPPVLIALTIVAGAIMNCFLLAMGVALLSINPKFLQDDLSIQKKEVEAEVSELCQYLNENFSLMEALLNTKIEECKQKLKNRFIQGFYRYDAESQLECFNQSLLELQKVNEYYSKMQDQ